MRFLTMARLQKRGSIPEALPLPSSRSMNAEFHVLELEIPQELAGQRLDSALARLLPEHSRTRIKSWIEAGEVRVGRLRCKPSDTAAGGSRVTVRMALDAPTLTVLPEAIALRLVYEDRDLFVVGKPS